MPLLKAHTQRRPEQLKQLFIELVDKHLQDLVAGKDEDMLEIEDFARLMYIHPTHLSNTIRETTGGSPCDTYQHKIIESAKKLLADPALSIQDIALTLTFDPSQFTKWFKRLAGLTPKAYRKQLSLDHQSPLQIVEPELAEY